MTTSSGPPFSIDATDDRILTLLTHNARQPAEAIGRQVGLSPSAVRRRIDRLEQSGVIKQYTTVIETAGPIIEAYVEVELKNGASADAFLSKALDEPGVREGTLVAGRPDAVLRVRATTSGDLGETVRRLRTLNEVSTTKTLIAIGTMRS